MKSNWSAVTRRRSNIARRIRLPILLVSLTLANLLPMTTAAQTNTGLPDAQYTAEGAERCQRCHAGERMMLMAETAHGNAANPDTPYAQHGCESCHGPGSLHVSRARGGRGFPALVTFGQDGSVKRQTEACIGCHAEDMGDLKGMLWTDSAHDTGTMTCISCHEAHVVGNPLKDQQRQRESCSMCHSKQVAGHPRFEDKGIVFDKLTCYDCHDVHQLTSEP
jgi:DmsE family decaheme c-type cytochrome